MKSKHTFPVPPSPTRTSLKVGTSAIFYAVVCVSKIDFVAKEGCLLMPRWSAQNAECAQETLQVETDRGVCGGVVECVALMADDELLKGGRSLRGEK